MAHRWKSSSGRRAVAGAPNDLVADDAGPDDEEQREMNRHSRRISNARREPVRIGMTAPQA